MSDIYVDKSSIQGLGVFAGREYQENEVLHTIDDSRIVDDAHPVRPERAEYSCHCDYLSGGKVVLMPVPERHINSNCDPNTFVKTVGNIRNIFARRKILKGEEITYDYIINCNGGAVWQCQCGAKRCRGAIVSSFFDLPIELQLEYLPLLDDWFVSEHYGKVLKLVNGQVPWNP